MNEILLLISNLLIGLGLVFITIGVVALYRFESFFPRILAASKIDTVGGVTLLVGVALRHGFSWFTAKVVLLTLVMLLINPLTAHILTRYAYVSGEAVKNDLAKAEKEGRH